MLHVFILTLGYSRRSFHEPCVGETLSQFLDAHERAFEYFGGHTREHLTIARARSASPPATGASSGTPTFKQFADYWGFEPHLCRAYRAQTKGKVESGVKYFKRNFLPGPDASSTSRTCASSSASGRPRSPMSAIHGTTHERPADRFARERGHAHRHRRPARLPPGGAASRGASPRTTWSASRPIATRCPSR